MARIEKTVFISYRRADEPWGLAIFQDLTQHGYDVFIDYDGIASGNFEAVILENIRARAHFLVLLTPTALERCGDPKDWMRREIEAALDSQRNIVPLMLAGFDFGTPAAASQLTGKLAALKEYNGLEIPKGYFSPAMERLRNRFLNVRVDAVLHPASDSAQQVAKEQKDKVTMALGDEQRKLAEAQRRTEKRSQKVIKSGDDELQELQPAQTPNEVDLDLATARQRQTVADDHLVVLVHGINTRALWMGEVKPALEQAGFSVGLTSYGKFGVPRFLSPFPWLRQKVIRRVVSDINTAKRSHKLVTGSDPRYMSLIAHSFGTYVVGRILTDYPEFQWRRIIFCGSVVRDNFPFDQVLERFGAPLINEVGTKDYWPALAESAGWGYGSVGSTGFNRPPVETRWHKGYRHSDFLTELFCNEFWVPFLRGDKPKRADKPAELPYWIRTITWLPLRWILVGVPVALPLIVGQLFWTNLSDRLAATHNDACKQFPALCGDSNDACKQFPALC